MSNLDPSVNIHEVPVFKCIINIGTKIWHYTSKFCNNYVIYAILNPLVCSLPCCCQCQSKKSENAVIQWTQNDVVKLKLCNYVINYCDHLIPTHVIQTVKPAPVTLRKSVSLGSGKSWVRTLAESQPSDLLLNSLIISETLNINN